jgi:glycosyltransferase involved in cell wall biosynthesis
MNILMVVDHKIPTDIRIENEAEVLIKHGHHVGILSIGDYSKSEEIVYKGITIYRIAFSKFLLKKMHGLAGIIPVLEFVIERHVKRILKIRKYDALHLHDLYTFGVITRLKPKFDLLFIGDMHENYVEVLKDYDWPNRFPNNLIFSHTKWEKNELRWLPLFDKIITVSEGIRRRLIQKGVKEVNALITPNSIRLDLFDSFKVDEKIIQKYSGKFVLLYVGGFIGNRGLEHVIKALPSIEKKIKNVRLVLVGDGEERKNLEKLVRELKLNNLVEFEGWKQQSEIKSYLKAAHIGLVPFKKTPQTDNSSSNKLFQYMYYHLPIVATNCDSVKKLVEMEKCGIIYESENVKQFEKSILTLYTNQLELSIMGNNGYKAVFERHNWDIASAAMIEMYNQFEIKKLIS